jgi:hypothetical protein
MSAPGAGTDWPEAPAAGWLETCAAIHMRAQVVGKILLARAPMTNHWWQVAMQVTARGLTTGPVPDGPRIFQIDFDFLRHRVVIATSDGRAETMPVAAVPLRDFYAELFARLAALGIDVRIWPVPVEVPVAVPFDEDDGHAAYNPDIATRLWRMFVTADTLLREFRGGFIGKASPVHVFWGGLDLAVTRFSGREAPPHPGGIPNLADWATREAYSHEVSSCGFWPGNAGGFERPAFYAYAYPAPEGFAEAPVRPRQAFFSPVLREFLLPYDEIRAAEDPASLVREFLQSTYEAAADLARWDRASLEAPRR